MSILAVFRPPFGIAPTVARLPEGLSLAALADRMPDLPPEFAQRGVICINGQPVPRGVWPLVKPKPVCKGIPVEVTFHAPPRGGDDGGGKRVFAVIASIALTALTGGIATKGIAMLGIKGGSTAAYALAIGVSYVGSLALSALTQPPVAKQKEQKPGDEGTASVEGNVLAQNGPIPRVVGERKIFPPFAAEPITWFDGPDEVVEAIYCLAGPHRLTDIRIGNAPIETLAVEYETREGWPGDPRLTMVRRQGRTEQVQTELRGHAVSDTDGVTLDTTSGDLAAALPQPYVVATRAAPDEHWLQIAFAQGLHLNASETTLMRVPLRLRIRRMGESDWINLPELHFQGANIRQMRATIVLEWDDGPIQAPSAAVREGFVEARRFSPGQTVAPACADWVADAYFGTGGDAWASDANLGSTGVQYTYCSRHEARFVLDPATFPRDRYEVEVMRGAAFDASTYVASSYEVSGSVWDLFGYRGTPGQIVRSRDGVMDSLYLVRSVSIWNEHPVPTDELALIAVRARNRALDAVSVIAGGWVRDWDGTAWRTWAVTDNPAPHLRDILAGDMNLNAVPAAMIDDAALVTWRAEGHRCNAPIEGLSVGEAANLVAACGYARPYLSDRHGVVRDYDRSGEVPVQIFTPRNSAGFQWSKGFPKIPDGLRVSYRDETDDYDLRQIVVARPGFVGTPRFLEQVTYEGITTEAEARARALYDLAQGEYRNTFYSLSAPAEAIVCQKGSLVGVQHDLLSAHHGSARVAAVTTNLGGEVTGITLDSTVPILNEPDLLGVTDLLAVDDMLVLGMTSAVIVRGPDGPLAAVGVSGATGETASLTLEAPMDAADVPVGALAVVGPRETELLRLVVQDIQPEDDLGARLTLVDEAPEIWAA